MCARQFPEYTLWHTSTGVLSGIMGDGGDTDSVGVFLKIMEVFVYAFLFLWNAIWGLADLVVYLSNISGEAIVAQFVAHPLRTAAIWFGMTASCVVVSALCFHGLKKFFVPVLMLLVATALLVGMCLLAPEVLNAITPSSG
jgi:hypothetical protein